MKLLCKTFLVLLLTATIQASAFADDNTPDHQNAFVISQTSVQKALKQRGIKVTRDKDDLVRRTIQAYGGDYVRNGDTVTLTLNGKTYSDFILELVEDGKQLVIITPNDTIWLEVVDK